ncbi:TPM domain-containing protein [Corynebacterium yonathiae]|uniref:TPM domain-containing protein n=1 Tax=Corynebacterium yonathiae TaxID=2913504 RepID=A0A9X3RLY4_9CORY|nr:MULTISPECIES: hypothetical protein [Corynebacterium]MCZ9296899.1 hypothetical protein [Corynebacterium yonathiae]MDK2583780.1 hypothetical protein [Corynebacterium sp. BWA136]
MRWVSCAAAVGLLTVASAPATLAEEKPAVEFLDHAQILSDSDEDAIKSQAQSMHLPNSVHAVLYATYPTSGEDFSRTLFHDLAHEHPQFVSGDALRKNVLVIAVGFEPNSMAVHCGTEVCQDIKINDEGRVDGILDQMRSALADDDYTVGMILATRAAADTTVRRQYTQDKPTWSVFIAATLVIVLLGTVGLIAYLFVRRARLRQRFNYIERARDEAEDLITHTGSRINALQSPLAGDHLKRQWRSLVNRHIDARPILKTLESIQDYSLHAASIKEAYEALKQIKTAATQIDSLERFCDGDTAVRDSEVQWLLSDARAALSRQPDNASLHQITQRINDLSQDLSREDFDSAFARLLADYHPLVGALPERLYPQRDRKIPPLLGTPEWRPGMGTHYMPYRFAGFWVANNNVSSQLPNPYRF